MLKGVVESVASDGKTCVVHPITDTEISWTAVVPWWMRKETGKSIAPREYVVFERFADGTAFLVSRFDGDGGEVLFGNPLLLGDASASDFVALASKVQRALADIQTWATTHTHPGVTPGEGTSGTSPTPPFTAGIPRVGAEKVKAK